MSDFVERYREYCNALKDECDKMVENGEMTEEMARFRYDMVKDEILESMDE